MLLSICIFPNQIKKNCLKYNACEEYKAAIISFKGQNIPEIKYQAWMKWIFTFLNPNLNYIEVQSFT